MICDLVLRVESHPFLLFHDLQMAKKEQRETKKTFSKTHGLISIALLVQQVKQLCEV